MFLEVTSALLKETAPDGAVEFEKDCWSLLLPFLGVIELSISEKDLNRLSFEESSHLRMFLRKYSFLANYDTSMKFLNCVTKYCLVKDERF